MSKSSIDNRHLRCLQDLEVKTARPASFPLDSDSFIAGQSPTLAASCKVISTELSTLLMPGAEHKIVRRRAQ